MQYSHTEEKAKNYFAQVTDKVQALSLPLTPHMYELWYVHFSGENHELSHAISLLKDDAITAELCLSLYNEFLNTEHDADQVRAAGSQIQTTIADVNALVSGVKDVTSQYNQTLTSVSEKLDKDGLSQDEVQVFLNDVRSDTQNILQQNQALEDKLSAQAETMVQLQQDLDRAKQEAMTDGLTNVSNRKAFDLQIDALIDETLNSDGQSFSLILMDIDHFKAFNDTYGHQVGDQVLRLVARTLFDGVKGRDFVARYGGEEFAVLLPGTNQHAAERVANSLREAVAKKEIVNKHSGEKMGRIELSGGVTEFYAGDSKDDMVERADEALYKAKEKGRNQICVAKIELARK